MAGIVRKIVKTSNAPTGAGPFSQAVIVDRTMYISGQIGQDLGGNLVSESVLDQADQALKNMGEILKSQGLDFSNVVKCTVLLADINDFARVNEVYKNFFKVPYPARAAYQAAALPKNARIEIEAIAVLGPIVDVDDSKL
ncbi:2-iminobutanoate/2-iminopropanoate deaminase-like isoform X2 [Ptychodera flava]|uniref:2-iminobutanoate/2-iminopropanoate deaminase-like isoform X2 n=1 Tax=Ptychodera flava TaxID=63121 RepID=UPI00396A3B2B